jgi:hypothetical protein
MRIKRHILSVLVVVLFFLTLLTAFGYANSLVSYKYEVQDSQTIGKDPLYGLDNHQKQIMRDVDDCKIEAISFAILTVISTVIRISKPTFKGRILYI